MITKWMCRDCLSQKTYGHTSLDGTLAPRHRVPARALRWRPATRARLQPPIIVARLPGAHMLVSDDLDEASRCMMSAGSTHRSHPTSKALASTIAARDTGKFGSTSEKRARDTPYLLPSSRRASCRARFSSFLSRLRSFFRFLRSRRSSSSSLLESSLWRL